MPIPSHWTGMLVEGCWVMVPLVDCHQVPNVREGQNVAIVGSVTC